MAWPRRGSLVILYLIILLGVGTYRLAGQRALIAARSWAATPTAQRVAATEGRAANQVQVLGLWAGPDLDGFWAVVRPFARRTGITVSFETAPDVASILAARVEEGVPPDIAILPGFALVQRYAQAGSLVPLRQILAVDRLYEQYPQRWLSPASAKGELYGFPCRAVNESLVWYDPAQFQSHRWTVPATWSEMVRLAEDIANRGLSPWSIGLQGQGANGEPGTDWIENLILRLGGPEAYDRWVRHEIPWTDPVVREAFLRWGQIVGRPRYLHGGCQGATRTDWATAVDALYQEVPAAYLCLGSSLMQPVIARHFANQKAGRDYDFFPLPPTSPQSDAPVLGSVDVVVVFNNTPEVRALVQYLASREAQMAWVQRGGFAVPSRDIAWQDYPDPLSRRAARQLLEAPVLRFDASDQMPPEMGRAFHQAVLDFVANPSRLGAILAATERTAREVYATLPAPTRTQPAQPIAPQGPPAGAPWGAPDKGTPGEQPTE